MSFTILQVAVTVRSVTTVSLSATASTTCRVTRSAATVPRISVLRTTLDPAARQVIGEKPFQI